MAYPVASGGVLELTFEGQLHGQQVMNVYHWYMQKVGGIDDGFAAATAFLAWIQGASTIWDTYLQCCSDEYGNIQAYAQWITPLRYRYVVGAAAPATGALAAASMPVNVQGSITMFGDEANRHNIGRKAIPGIPVDNVDSSIVDALQLTRYQEHMDQLLQDFVGPEGEDYSLVIFNRAEPELSPYVVDGFPQPTVRVERRRTVRVGS